MEVIDKVAPANNKKESKGILMVGWIKRYLKKTNNSRQTF